jgi:hypothetical protein
MDNIFYVLVVSMTIKALYRLDSTILPWHNANATPSTKDRNHPLSRKLRPFRRVILGAQRAETKIIDSHADAVTPVHNTANAHTRSAHKRKIVHQPNLKTILKKSERVFVSRVYRYYCPLQYSILLCISYKYRS